MRPLLLPIILVLIAGTLFAVYTDPTYQDSKVLRVKLASYDDALRKSQELRSLRDQLVAKRNSFSAESLSRLQRILPDNVDNIRLIIDINSIAARHGLTLANVELGDITDSKAARSDLAAGGSGDPIGSVTLGFSVVASYEELLVLLQDLEHSLRLIDVEKLTFSTSADTNKMTNKFTIRTYWLR